ncbi:hypothetical protein FOCC_FOCC017349, partial [Frankliniella occidentalis]
MSDTQRGKPLLGFIMAELRDLNNNNNNSSSSGFVSSPSPSLDLAELLAAVQAAIKAVAATLRYLEQHGRSSGAGGRPSLRSVLQPGKNLVAAGYALYASSTLLVLTTGPGVHLFVLDPVLGEFILTAPNLTIPGRGRIYSVDEGLTYEWGDPVVEYLGVTYGSHHMGCSVADVHTVLRNGGIYLSPQARSHPNGKLRLVLEAAPLAHLVCRAGGLATDGHVSLTDCQPEGLAHRTAAFMGSREDVRDVLSMFRRSSA